MLTWRYVCKDITESIFKWNIKVNIKIHKYIIYIICVLFNIIIKKTIVLFNIKVFYKI